MQSFTWGSDEGMRALVENQHKDFFDPNAESWEISPNPADFKTLIHALKFAAENAASLGDLALCEQAAELLSSIAESLGIEFI
jgi:hypothetical protein